MKWDRFLATSIAATLLAVSVGLTTLAGAWIDRHSALSSTQLRLADLRAKRLDPRDAEILKRVLSSSDPHSGLLIAADGDSISRLESHIRLVAQNHNAEVLSISAAEGTIENDLPVIRGSVHLVVSDAYLGPLIKSLETGNPTIFLERLRISSKSGSSTDNELPTLDLVTSIIAYRELSVAERVIP